ncbi:MAG: N(4)-(beta-N-acetylglucosaminyl)-L-asparaginase [Bacteroidetes bacterium]|jgi:N4-(beta-N-acetylglucosaminyl)-L-asparaginase|nr:N(4)-(beta-N-acetylglucosaminyl)-L-asparaginase [Bacteroidota bacterium]
MNRRKFFSLSALSSAGLILSHQELSAQKTLTKYSKGKVVATWNVPDAVATAYTEISVGKTALDAIEAGCRAEESNVSNTTVGKGGLPDRDGKVTLDACIMDSAGNAGSVVFLEEIEHPISVARRVMEQTPHVMLAGVGAQQFALSQGFKKVNLLTESSEKAYRKWLKTSEYKPIINIENHDTIGMLAIDLEGNLSGGCTTSGLAYKMRGRVGDSPIIGSGLYIDNEIGGATATGLGEEILKSVGSFLIVELMRQGAHPSEACEEAVRRIAAKSGSKVRDFQAGFIAIRKDGEVGGYAIHPGFNYTVADSNQPTLNTPATLL